MFHCSLHVAMVVYFS